MDINGGQVRPNWLGTVAAIGVMLAGLAVRNGIRYASPLLSPGYCGVPPFDTHAASRARTRNQRQRRIAARRCGRRH